VARILIVDDAESDRVLEQAILERHGHETFLAADGEEALRKYQLKGIEVVITDLQMPVMHGFELITVLRDFSLQPSIIAVSGTGPDQLHMANALGAKFTLRKPLDPERLIAAVEQVLAVRAQSARDEIA
jgi:chemosensory pili system protein ChpA (sensor histidine kinase/response regulator)